MSISESNLSYPAHCAPLSQASVQAQPNCWCDTLQSIRDSYASICANAATGPGRHCRAAIKQVIANPLAHSGWAKHTPCDCNDARVAPEHAQHHTVVIAPAHAVAKEALAELLTQIAQH